MSPVIDASLTLAWFFEDERTPAADSVLDEVATTGALAPALWRLEVANGLQSAKRRKRIDAAFRNRALDHLSALPIAIDPETDARAWTATLGLADRFNLTLYDVTYLELALRRAAPLASLDAALRDDAQALGVALKGA